MQSPSTNINNAFFEGSYKEAWKGIIPPGLTEAEVDFIQEMGSLKNGGKVLDFMCGYGRHALELGRRGVQVTAIDNLQAYVDEIKTKASEENLPVKASQADILHAQLNDVYDAAICMGNCFAFFDRTDAVAILKNISGHLKTSGILIIMGDCSQAHAGERHGGGLGDLATRTPRRNQEPRSADEALRRPAGRCPDPGDGDHAVGPERPARPRPPAARARRARIPPRRRRHQC